MAERKENNNGCAIPIIAVIILIIGWIFRFVYDKEAFLNDMWAGFMTILILFLAVWVYNNYRN